ncbi:nuclear transport factor 2 family protein [Streptomyces sp. NPDC048479]|uniref:nuclear transport factor 2 family protein n=1 Tax=Streptomyces sp. NPDC048479 TaxID=3154725 RepID=UPI00343F69A0
MDTSYVHPNATVLRSLYADLARIADYVDDDVVLHTAQRGIVGRPSKVHGKEAVLAHERDLIRLTGHTLVMDVEHITANDEFGAVLGTLRAHRDRRDIAMPFCGLWRFKGGRIVEHWEHAYDPLLLDRSLTGGTEPVAP